MYPIGIQSVHGFLSEEENKDYIGIEDLALEGAIITNLVPEGGSSTMVVIKWSEKVVGSGYNIYSPLCGVLYKEEEYYLFPCIIRRTGVNIYCLQTLPPFLKI